MTIKHLVNFSIFLVCLLSYSCSVIGKDYLLQNFMIPLSYLSQSTGLKGEINSSINILRVPFNQ